MDKSLIFDIGCHIGEDSDFYLKKGFKVVAVEANPVLCAELRKRFSQQIDNGDFTLIESAIAEHDGEVTFYVDSKNTIWGTIRSEMADRNAALGAISEKVVVPSITFASLLNQYGIPYYLKIDIEGADQLCLDGLMEFSERPKFVSIESEIASLSNIRLEIRTLEKLGYTKFQIVDQAQIPDQKPPNPALEGMYADHRFDLGSTGLFGNELRGEWLSAAGTLAGYAKIFLRNKMFGLSKKIGLRLAPPSHGLWYDTHAMR
jgi:FkbM family methyltransferase